MNNFALFTLALIFTIPFLAKAQVSVRAVAPTDWQVTTSTALESQVRSNETIEIEVPETAWKEGRPQTQSFPKPPPVVIEVSPSAAPVAFEARISEPVLIEDESEPTLLCSGWKCAPVSYVPTPTQQVAGLATLVKKVEPARKPTAPRTEAAPAARPAVRNTAGLAISYASKLQRFVRSGARAGARYCARGVRFILENAGLVPRRTPYQQESAKDFFKYLKHYGFVDDKRFCNTPGVIRVYDKTRVAVSRRNRTAGDIHGHVEILGTDGRFHSSYSNHRSVDKQFGSGRRPLIHCLIRSAELQ